MSDEKKAVHFPFDAPLPELPLGFRSKVIVFDVFKSCSKCQIKKYVERGTHLCFACHGGP